MLNYWTGEVTSKNIKNTEDVRCFNCDKQGHLKRDFTIVYYCSLNQE